MSITNTECGGGCRGQDDESEMSLAGITLHDRVRLHQLLRNPGRDGKVVDDIFRFDPRSGEWGSEFGMSLHSISRITSDLLIPGSEEEALRILEYRVETLLRFHKEVMDNRGRRDVLQQMQCWKRHNDCLMCTSTSLDDIFARCFPEIAMNSGKGYYCPHVYPMLTESLEIGWPHSTLTFETMILSEGVKPMLKHVGHGVLSALRRRLARDTSLFKERRALAEFATKTVLARLSEETLRYNDKEVDLLCGLICSIWPDLLTSHLKRYQFLYQYKPSHTCSKLRTLEWSASAYHVWRHYIAVDKAILSHCFTCAKSPLHRLAPIRDLQAVVYTYLYGPHSFPKRFFRDVYTPTKGHHIAHKSGS